MDDQTTDRARKGVERQLDELEKAAAAIERRIERILGEKIATKGEKDASRQG
jgi:hypothetical protein